MPALREAFLILPNGSRVALTKERVTVGRTGSKCDVIIDDASVSRNHALLHWDGERWTVTDMGARNKTFVDEKPLEANTPAPLRDGCTLHFGFYATRFGLGAEAEADAGGNTMDFNMAQAMQEAEARKRSASATIPDAGPGGEVFATLQLHSVTNPITYRITHELVTIGTDATNCEVAIIDSMASPRHAELRFAKGNRVFIKKVGSSQLRVNNRMVNEVSLTTGDEVGIGESKFTFRLVKFPDNLTIKESASSKVARLVVGSLLVVMVVGGWYAWKVLGPQGGDAEAEQRRIERAQVTEARRYTPESILDLVTTRRYDEAIEDAERMVEQGISADVVARWPADIRNLRDATAARSRGEAGPAFMALSKVNPSSQVLAVASREASDIRQRYQDWLTETKAAVEQAEKRADWAMASQLLDALVEFHAPERAYYEGVRQRITLRRDARAVYDEVLETVAEDPAAALERTQETLQRVRTEGAGLPDAENAFREPLLELADAEAHAQFLLAYNGFTGDMAPFEAFATVPRATYPARKSIDDGMARLRQVAAVQERINAAVAALPRNAPPSREIFAQMDSIVAMYDELLAVEDDRNFSLARAASAGIEEVNNTKRSEIFKRAGVQVTIDDSLEGDQRILQEALAQRRKWFRILELYPAEAILSEGREDDLRVLLRDPDLFAEFKNARQEYNATLSTINGVMLTAAINRDQAILAQRTEVFTLLDETTIDIDSFGRDRVDNLRSRLNEMLGPE